MSEVGFTLEMTTTQNVTGGQTFAAVTKNSGTDGKVEFTGLPYGEYKITETAPLTNYRQNKAVITFSIASDGTVSTPVNLVYSDEYSAYTFTNYLGSFTLTKIDAVSSGAMAGVKFELYEKINGEYESVTTPELPNSGITDTNGKLAITGLYLETDYQLREVATGSGLPVGYKDSQDYTNVTFKLIDGDESSNYIKSGTYENYRDKIYSFGFIKKDDQNPGTVLQGATFGLFSDSGCTTIISGFDAKGKPESGGTQITATSGSDGKVTFGGACDGTAGVIPFGTYYVKELTAPAATAPEDAKTTYAKSGVILTVDIANTGSYSISDGTNSVTGVSKNTMSSFVVKNELLGSITVTKQDADNENATITESPATFEIRDGSATGTLVGTAQNTVSGVTTFTGLKLNKDYYLVEKTAPTGV